LFVLVVRLGRSLTQNRWVEQGVSRKAATSFTPCAGRLCGRGPGRADSRVNGFTLAIGVSPMLETARIGGDAGPS
jgi:hypothetical protein